MSICGIQGHSLEITVVGCTKLKDTEWISRQDPYVCLEYGSTKFRTRTCKDGNKNPNFQEKFVFNLIEGLRELNVVVWNNHHLSTDELIGSGKIQLQKVLSQGFDDTSWALQGKGGRYAGEVRLILHYPNFNKPNTNYPSQAPQVPTYSAPPPAYCPPPQPSPVYNYQPPPQPAYYPPPPQPTYYPPSPSPYQPSCPPLSAHLTPQSSLIYPPPQYPSSSIYPPPPQPSYYPPDPNHSVYPPPPHY